MPTVAHTALQALALIACVAGLYLLAGIAWALLVAGALVFSASVLTELGRPHPTATAPAPTSGPDLRTVA